MHFRSASRSLRQKLHGRAIGLLLHSIRGGTHGNAMAGTVPAGLNAAMEDMVQTLVEQIVGRIAELQEELEDEFERRRAELELRVENGRVVFEQEIRRRHAALKARLARYVLNGRPLVILTAPVIYCLALPLLLLDLAVMVYQAVCFPVYGIAKVKRSKYIVFDRHRLAYLNAIEKLNCVYCSYANGLFAYCVEVASRTEQYWCPIKHARRIAGAHARYPGFFEYGDAEAYRDRFDAMRADLTRHRPDA